MQNKKSIWKWLTEYFAVFVASMLISVAMYTFVTPTKLFAGGITGVASAVSFVVCSFVDTVTVEQLMPILYMAFNVPIMILALVFLRGDFTAKTIFSIVVSTVAMSVLPELFPTFQFSESRIISTIMGGVLLGGGMYVAYVNNASNGGTEIIGKVISVKRPEVDLSKVITILNFSLTVSRCLELCHDGCWRGPLRFLPVGRNPVFCVALLDLAAKHHCLYSWVLALACGWFL